MTLVACVEKGFVNIQKTLSDAADGCTSNTNLNAPHVSVPMVNS